MERTSSERDRGTPIERRTVITGLLAAGVLAPLVGSGTAHASADDWYPIPEECGSVPWW